MKINEVNLPGHLSIPRCASEQAASAAAATEASDVMADVDLLFNKSFFFSVNSSASST